jgi:hypothetical protein
MNFKKVVSSFLAIESESIATKYKAYDESAYGFFS